MKIAGAGPSIQPCTELGKLPLNLPRLGPELFELRHRPGAGTLSSIPEKLRKYEAHTQAEPGSPENPRKEDRPGIRHQQ